MITNNEVQRIKEVYRTYRESTNIQSRWAEGNRGNQAMLQERTYKLRQMLLCSGFFPLKNCRILEVGCGKGKILAGLIQLGALPNRLYGVDLLPDRIKEAKQKLPASHLRVCNAEKLYFHKVSFDLILLFTVFSSVLDPKMGHNVATEVNRVLKPGGVVVWYDFKYNNPFNPHVRGMTKKAIHRLFPDFDLHLKTLTLLPLLARHLGQFTPIIYPALSILPFLRTHYLGLLIKQK